MTSPEKRYSKLFKEMYDLCEQQGWGDPFSYAVSREIAIANELGHQKASTYSGADGIDEEGECEYKSTIGKNINGAYNGISVQPTWEEQVKYLTKEKIAKYKNHYIARFDNGVIVECYKLKGWKVLDLLLPKLKKSYENTLSKKDPRLGASLSKKEIHLYGEKII
jgi:hypothetical protein